MHFSRRTLLILPLFVCALVLLRQGIVVATQQVPAIGRQVDVMQQQDIDPAALFYTDSRVALRAIRQAEAKVN
jgi:hypothetical protein